MPGWINNSANGGEPSRQRKRWEIEDKKLLKNLKYQLAEDGSKDVQYDLGKQLVEDADGKQTNKILKIIDFIRF
jgi:hypothetical protein